MLTDIDALALVTDWHPSPIHDIVALIIQEAFTHIHDCPTLLCAEQTYATSLALLSDRYTRMEPLP
jgi:hypothetical protein